MAFDIATLAGTIGCAGRRTKVRLVSARVPECSWPRLWSVKLPCVRVPVDDF